jgi:hypothetical protein
VSVTFETTQGGIVTAFACGECFTQEESVDILGIRSTSRGSSRTYERSQSVLEAVADERSYFAKGQVAGLEVGTTYVDCGGFIVHLWSQRYRSDPLPR